MQEDGFSESYSSLATIGTSVRGDVNTKPDMKALGNAPHSQETVVQYEDDSSRDGDAVPQESPSARDIASAFSEHKDPHPDRNMNGAAVDTSSIAADRKIEQLGLILLLTRDISTSIILLQVLGTIQATTDWFHCKGDNELCYIAESIVVLKTLQRSVLEARNPLSFGSVKWRSLLMTEICMNKSKQSRDCDVTQIMSIKVTRTSW